MTVSHQQGAAPSSSHGAVPSLARGGRKSTAEQGLDVSACCATPGSPGDITTSGRTRRSLAQSLGVADHPLIMSDDPLVETRDPLVASAACVSRTPLEG